MGSHGPIMMAANGPVACGLWPNRSKRGRECLGTWNPLYGLASRAPLPLEGTPYRVVRKARHVCPCLWPPPPPVPPVVSPRCPQSFFSFLFSEPAGAGVSISSGLGDREPAPANSKLQVPCPLGNALWRWARLSSRLSDSLCTIPCGPTAWPLCEIPQEECDARQVLQILVAFSVPTFVYWYVSRRHYLTRSFRLLPGPPVFTNAESTYTATLRSTEYVILNAESSSRGQIRNVSHRCLNYLGTVVGGKGSIRDEHD